MTAVKAAVLALGFAFAAAAPAMANTAVLRGLDKVTGQTQAVNAPVGKAVRFGTLEITTRACQKSPEEEAPETAVYLEVRDIPLPRQGQKREPVKVFSGWIFGSSPALNALEHPVYDLWAIDCKS